MLNQSERDQKDSASAASGGDDHTAPARNEMRKLLMKLKPRCASAALNSLKSAFPSSPLEERVNAYESYAANIRRVFPRQEN